MTYSFQDRKGRLSQMKVGLLRQTVMQEVEHAIVKDNSQVARQP